MTEGRQYRVPADMAEMAEKEAINIRKTTGKMVRWTDIIRKALRKYFKKR